MLEIAVRADWRQDSQVWDAALATWLESVASVHTRTTYRVGITQFIAWMHDPTAWAERAGKRGAAGRTLFQPVSSIAPWSVTISDVDRWCSAMTQAGLSAATVNSRLAALSAFYDYCRTKMMRLNGMTPETLVTINPVDGVNRPKLRPRKRVVLTVQQARSLIRHQTAETLSGLRNRALLMCYLFTGLRNSEIRGLRWGDFSVDEDGVVRVFWTGKGGSGGERKVRPMVYAAIRAYLGAAKKLPEMTETAFVFTPLTDDAAHFPHIETADRERPLSRQRVNAIIKACARRAGLNARMITTHTLRRTAATLFYEASGFDIEETRKMLSHARLETTIRYVNQERVDADTVWQTVEEWFGL